MSTDGNLPVVVIQDDYSYECPQCGYDNNSKITRCIECGCNVMRKQENINGAEWNTGSLTDG